MDETASNQFSSNSSPLAFHINIQNYNQKSKRAEVEYCIQHTRWHQLRAKMKSMKLSQHTSNTYLKAQCKDKYQLSGPSEDKGKVRSTEKKMAYSRFSQRQKDEPQHVQQNPENCRGRTKIAEKELAYPLSKHNQQKKRFLETYMKEASGSERTRPQTQQYRGRNNILAKEEHENDMKIQKFVMNGSKEATSKVFDIKNKKRIRNLNLNLNLNLNFKNTNDKMQANKNIEKSIKNKNLYSQRVDSQENAESIFQQLQDDFIQLSKLQDKDYRERVVVRRKTNVNGQCFQAIEAAIIKGQIIFFTIDVTTGNLNEFDWLHGFRSASSTQYNIRKSRLKSERQIKYHNPTGTRQLKLLIGSNQAKQYLQIFGLSYHPLQFTKSLTKVAIILVDYLTASEGIVKIEKNQIISTFVRKKNIQREDKTKKLFENNELVRWRTKPKTSKHERLVLENNIINHSYSHQISHNSHKGISGNIESEIMLYQVYGHPHPIFNGKQSEHLLKKEMINGEEDQETYDKKMVLQSNKNESRIHNEYAGQSNEGRRQEQRKEEKKKEYEYEYEQEVEVESIIMNQQLHVSIEQSGQQKLGQKIQVAEISSSIGGQHIEETQKLENQINGKEEEDKILMQESMRYEKQEQKGKIKEEETPIAAIQQVPKIELKEDIEQEKDQQEQLLEPIVKKQPNVDEAVPT